MSKKTKQKKTEQKISPSMFERLNQKKIVGVCFLIIFITLLVFYKPCVFEQLEPSGGDRIGSIGKTHQYTQYNKTTGETALWNPNIFCGLPIYYNLNSNAFHIDKLISAMDSVIDWRVGWFIFGAAGMFALIQLLGFPWYYGLLGALLFLFFPHYQALIIVGHNFKIRALCALPMVIYGFLRLIKKGGLISFSIFALAFSLQIRTKHFQIIFYTLLLMLAIGIWQLVVLIQAKEYRKISGRLLLLIASFTTAVLISAQPLFMINEYTPYSTRGGNAISLAESKDASQKSGGVTFDYATRWSLAPAELMTLISPRFFGGTSQEYYTGKKYPQLKNRAIPGYWGQMPFTQSSEYMGVIVVILAIAGIWYFRRDGFVIALSILLMFSIFLAFGRHFPLLYKLFFYYLPYFSKFRVPMMILTLIQFILIILSLYGLKGLLNEFNFQKFKNLLIICGVFIVIGLIPLLNPGMLAYTSANDAQYASNPQVLDMLKSARMEMMVQDTVRMIFLIVAFVVMLGTFYYKKISRDLLIIGTILIISIDMISVSYRFMKHERLVRPDRIEQQYFRITKIDQILKKDTGYYRILGLGGLFQSNDLAYRHQIIGGYSAIKPQLIQDIIDNNLYTSNTKEPINWNVVNMLNGKYILSPAQLTYAGLSVLDVDQKKRTILYQNNNCLPRAYFVESVQSLPTETDVVAYLNNPDFDPAKIAITSETLKQNTFSAECTAEITKYSPNQITLKASCQDTAFMVLSEAYYPVGWLARIDKETTRIYQTNHILRGIIVPPGDHLVSFEFSPRSYYRSKRISTIFTYLTWLVLIGSILYKYRDPIMSKVKHSK